MAQVGFSGHKSSHGTADLSLLNQSVLNKKARVQGWADELVLLFICLFV